MHVSESNPPVGPPFAAPAPAPPEPEAPTVTAPAVYQQCDDCGSAVDADQRYCVVCGAHRRHVNDPAARHLSQATARSRSVPATSPVRQATRAGGRARGLGTALVVAVILVVAALGVMVGRSSNNQDSTLIQALARRQAAVVTVAAGAAGTGTAATAVASRTHSTGPHRAKRTGSSGNSTASPRNAGKVISTTQYGSAQQITGFKPTTSAEQQGAQATKQVQKSTGKTYVNSQSNLPSQVVVP
jgi:hypothetical protein